MGLDKAAEEISRLYAANGEDFEALFEIKAANIRRQLLEEFIQSPISDAETSLQTVGRLYVVAVRESSRSATITGEQQQDFADRIDIIVAEASVIIEKAFQGYNNRYSPEFQEAAARDLGLVT